MVEGYHGADHEQVIALLDLGEHASARVAADIPVRARIGIAGFLDDFCDTEYLDLAVVFTGSRRKGEDVAYADNAVHDVLHLGILDAMGPR